jgi:hypothetical protein
MFHWSTDSETHGYDKGLNDLDTIQGIAMNRKALVMLWNGDVEQAEDIAPIGHVEPNGKVEWL